MMAVSESMQWMVHMQSPDSDHHEKLAMDDMPKVLKIIDTVMECMRNPFVPTVAAEKLVNIAKGEIFTSSDVVDSKQLGLDVIAHARSTDAEKIISPKILTFAGQQKQTKKRQDSVKQIVSEEGTVARALCFTRELTEEADFLDTLQNKVSDTWKPLEELPPSALTPVYVIDAMTSVQRFQTLGDSKFNQLQERYKDKIMKMKPMKPKMKPSVPSVMSCGIHIASVLGFGVKVEIIQGSLKELSGDVMCWNDYVSKAPTNMIQVSKKVQQGCHIKSAFLHVLGLRPPDYMEMGL
ncbi:hypothetical protein GQR58_003951 [Nymphon striatum]|nr:hypothetical protein GQR58_003951 [Nymphon striatum]